MRYLTVLVVLLVLLALAIPSVEGSNCRAVIRNNYVAPTVVKAVKAVEVVYPIVTQYVVPLYGATYVAPAEKSTDLSDAVRQLADQVRQLNERLAKVEGGKMPPADGKPEVRPGDPFNPDPQALKIETDAVRIFQAKCASCHEQGSENKGGGFVLLAGDRVARLSKAQAGELFLRCYDDDPAYRMPKNKPPLTDPEVAAISKWVKSIK